MKKQLFLATILMAAFFTASAQKPDMAQVLVHYKFTHVRDTTNREHPYTENMVLFIGSSASAYRSYDRQLQDALFKKQVADAKASSPDGNIRVNRQMTGSGTEYFQFPNERKFFTKERLLNAYLIENPVPEMTWKISSDTATFGGLHCQKATTHFKGRDYTAWFCPDLPVHTGPWKLNGLPGAIVDARDAKNEVVFKFDGVEKAMPTPKESAASDDHSGAQVVLLGMDDANGDPNVIELPAKAIRTSEKEFETLRETMRKDPNAFAQSMMAGQGGNLQGNGPKMNFKIKSGPGPVINNPIELPEKK
ncbi:MAG TPA: GLPGLI family protein [Mucilaginibacter sp.]